MSLAGNRVKAGVGVLLVAAHVAGFVAIAPDLREVSLVAEAFGLEEPAFDIRDQSDRAMAAKLSLTSGGPDDPDGSNGAFDVNIGNSWICLGCLLGKDALACFIPALTTQFSETIPFPSKGQCSAPTGPIF